MEGKAMPGRPGPRCPSCGEPMPATEVLSVGGIQDKPVRWSCRADGIEASAVHPVQIAHLRVGDDDAQHGQGRIVKLEMLGAELMVFRELVRAR